jgi:hypothetical protein
MAVQNFGSGGGGYQVSPGINISEIDLTTVVPPTSTTVGAIAGAFRWGPTGVRTLVTSENDLVAKFGKPTNINPETFFTAASFLSYSNALYVSRASNTAAVFNAVAGIGATASNAAHTVGNQVDYDAATFDASVDFIARYPGELGNSLKISVCDSVNAYSSAIDVGDSDNFDKTLLTLTVGSNTATVLVTNSAGQGVTLTQANTAAEAQLAKFSVGDVIEVGNSSIGKQSLKISSLGSITNAADITLATGNASSNATHLIYLASDPAAAGLSAGDLVTITGYSDADYNVSGATIAESNTTAFTIADTSNPSGETGTGSAAVTDLQTVNFTIGFTDVLKLSTNISTNNVTRYWEYYNQVDTAPGTSLFQSQTTTGNTTAVDELHVVVVDEDGGFTGNPGTVLEVYKGLSRATDAKLSDGSGNYYKNVINERSRYVWWAGDRSTSASATSATVASSSSSTPSTLSFVGGTDNDESTIAFADTARAYDLFKSAEDVDISLVLTGASRGGTYGEQQGNYLIDNIAEVRKDCVVFVSPQKADVVNASGAAAENIVQFRNALRSSSFAVLDSGYKYMYDKYNDVYRWVPMNGDIAGLCVVTDNSRDPWYSPAGTNRGQLRNVIRLAFNPSKGDRDLLYKNGINPVISSPGQGTILFGDKTLLNKPSAFDRINVRRLFIVLEKAIGRAAKSLMFEFNDEFTRTQFRNLVEPFLRDVQGRRGITDFKVVCDETNNTGEVIDSNRFIGDIYIKPARAINFIQLNFVAVRSGIEFSEIVG